VYPTRMDNYMSTRLHGEMQQHLHPDLPEVVPVVRVSFRVIDILLRSDESLGSEGSRKINRFVSSFAKRSVCSIE